MKRALWLFLFFALGLAVADVAQPRRFEKILTQDNDGGQDYVHYFEVWHDKVSGQEFVCPIGNAGDWHVRPVSCFPSGRNWK